MVHSGSFPGSRRRAAYLLLRLYDRVVKRVFTNRAGARGGGLIDSYIYASIGSVKEVMSRYAFLGLDWLGLAWVSFLLFFSFS